jgi:energy-coupling factor transport system permease protein
VRRREGRRRRDAALGFAPVYRPRASALHAARASAGIAFCMSLALVPLLYEHPLVLAAAACALLGAGAAAGVGGELARAMRITVPLALLFVAVNPIVSQNGQTVLVRGWEVLGQPLDVTLEALAYGGVAGLRLVVLGLAFSLYAAVVDPDEVLRLFRRFSYRSALTATLTTRLVPVMARDALRMSDAARCRPVEPGRAAVARATFAGALERALDVAAALEVRGYASAQRAPRAQRPWSRHDLRVMGSALAIAALALGAKAAGAGRFEPYPLLDMALGLPELALCTALVLVTLAPLAGAAARLGVARA